MIIYYHCNSDNALLLSFLPFHIFILVPPVFCIRRAELSHAHAQQKMTAPSRRARGRAMAFHSDFRGGKS